MAFSRITTREESSTVSAWFGLKDKGIVEVMFLDVEVAEVTALKEPFGGGVATLKPFDIFHLLNTEHNEVQIWETGPKRSGQIAAQIEDDDVTNTVFKIKRIGADVQTTYIVTAVRRMTAQDRANYEHAQQGRKDLALLKYTVIKQAVPGKLRGQALDEVGGELPF